MYFIILIALLSTLLYINTMITDIINIKANLYSKTDEEFEKQELLKAKFKIVLLTIMSVFWSLVIWNS